MYEASLSHFDLIILDVSAPRLESLKAVKLLRQLEEYSGQRALIVGVGEENGYDHLQELGFDGYLERPVTREKILKQLDVCETV